MRVGKNIICNVSHCVQLQTFDLTKKINEIYSYFIRNTFHTYITRTVVTSVTVTSLVVGVWNFTLTVTTCFFQQGTPSGSGTSSPVPIATGISTFTGIIFPQVRGTIWTLFITSLSTCLVWTKFLEETGSKRRQISNIKIRCCSLCGKLHNPLFSVGKLWKLGRSYWSINKIKMIGILLNAEHPQVYKNMTQRSLTGFITIPLH